MLTNSFCLNFNSIKVQLELSINPQVNTNFLEFQFHKGTIRTCYNGNLFST